MNSLNLSGLSENNMDLLRHTLNDFRDALDETDKTIISNCVDVIAGNINKLKGVVDQDYLEYMKNCEITKAFINKNEKKVDKINKLTQLIKTALENRH